MCKVKIDGDGYLKEYFEGNGKKKKKKFRRSALGTGYLSEISARRAISEARNFFSCNLTIEEWED